MTDVFYQDASWPRAGDYPAHQDHADVVLIGVPTHETSLSPTRADTTPRAIRESLRRYSHTFYHGDGGTRSLEGLTITDAGDIENPDGDRAGAIEHLRKVASQSSLVIALGGDNSATVPVATASLDSDWDSAGLITLDAHFDVRAGKSNGSPVRELLELGLPWSRCLSFCSGGSSARYGAVWGTDNFFHSCPSPCPGSADPRAIQACGSGSRSFPGGRWGVSGDLQPCFHSPWLTPTTQRLRDKLREILLRLSP